jgi:phosphoribosyl-ATP pyrophosphohydrolase
MFTLSDLDRIVSERATAVDGSSYTASLTARGTPHCARKLGEEAIETIVAATTGNGEELTGEAADLLYHLLVLLRSAGVPLSAVMEELEKRTAMSGLQEKASRHSDG